MEGNLILLSKIWGLQSRVFHYSDTSEVLSPHLHRAHCRKAKLALLVLQLEKLVKSKRQSKTSTKRPTYYILTSWTPQNDQPNL